MDPSGSANESLCGVYWNVERVACDRVDLFFVDVVAKYGFVLLQEKGVLDKHSGISRGHEVVCMEGDDVDRCPAVIVHRALVPRIVGTRIWRRVVGVRLRTHNAADLILISLHIPDTGKSACAFDHAIRELDDTIVSLCSVGDRPWRLVVGGDFNAEISADMATVGPCVSGPGDMTHALRESALKAFAQKWNLGWPSTWATTSGEHWTIHRKPTKRKSVLDYVWASNLLQVRTNIRYDLDFNADHRPMEIFVTEGAKGKTTNLKKPNSAHGGKIGSTTERGSSF